MASWNPAANELFLDALDIASGEERCAYLDRACGCDIALRREVDSLLGSADRAGDFLQSPAMQNGSGGSLQNRTIAATTHPAIDDSSVLKVSAAPGDRIGPYKLLTELGTGGMGAVFMAEQQEPVRRVVALKVIKAGMDSQDVIARFEHERQALALMDHPHIARVFDAGTTAAGRPYFVMELVNGVPITKYCDQERLTPQERLALFVPVCQAVQHAHQKGIIHRDLKPSNVLVAAGDAGAPGVPKVIDFGVAKAIDRRLTERTLLTEIGSIVGTLEYMAPEQAELNNIDIDTRADIYSLGVLLYELLTGVPPFTAEQLHSVAFTQMLHIIHDSEPPTPSARLASSDDLASIAACRRLEPRKLTKLIHGDLDWIVMKALEKDPDRRYPTASSLAADVRRHLADEPVLAGPPGVGYRLQKLLRRKRGLFGAAFLLLIVLVSGVIVSAWQAVRATLAERRTNFQLSRAIEAEANALAQEDAAKKQRWLAEEARKLAEDRKQATEQARQEAEAARERAEQATRRAQSSRLAALARACLNEHPQRSALLALQAAAETRQDRSRPLTEVQQALLDARLRLGGIPLPAHQHEIAHLRISPDGQWMVTANGGGQPGSLRLWRVARKIPNVVAELLESTFIHGFCFSHNSRWLVAWGILEEDPQTPRLQPKLLLWDLSDETVHRSYLVLKGPTRGVERTDGAIVPSRGGGAVAFSPDDRFVVAGGGDGHVLCWNLHGDKDSPVTLEAHTQRVSALAISPDGQWLVSGDEQGETRLWDFRRLSDSTKPTALTKQLKSVYRLVFSDDGKWLASSSWIVNAGDDQWNVHLYRFSNDQREFFELKGHNRPVTSFIFSNDSRQLVTASTDFTSGGGNGIAQVWDLTSPDPSQAARVLRGDSVDLINVDLSPDGKWLATAGRLNKRVLLYDLRSEDTSQAPIVCPIRDATGYLASVKFSPDGNWLVAGGDIVAHLWRIAQTGQVASTHVLKGHESTVSRIAFSPDSRLLITACSAPGGRYFDPMPRAWELDRPHPESPLPVFSGSGRNYYHPTFASSPDGEWLLVRESLWAELWSTTSDAEGRIHEAPLKQWDGIRAARLSKSGRLLALGGDDKRVHLLRLDENQVHELPDLPEHEWSVVDLGFSDDERWLYSVSHWYTRLWQLSPTGETEGPYVFPHSSRCRAAVLTPAGDQLITGAEDGKIRLWSLSKLPSGKPEVEVQAHREAVNALVVSSDGRWLASWSHFTGPNRDENQTQWDEYIQRRGWKKSLKLWQLNGAQAPLEFPLEGHVDELRRVRFSPNGEMLVSVDTTGEIRVWMLGQRDPSKSPVALCHPFDIWDIALSNDSKWLATAGYDKSVRVWDLTTPERTEPRWVLQGHEFPVHGLAFSPDRRWLVTCSGDETNRLWDLESPSVETSALVVPGRGSCWTAFFNQDGKWLFTTDEKGVTKWDLSWDREMQALPESIGRALTADERKLLSGS